MSPLKGLPRSWIFEDVSSLGGATTTTTSTSSTSTSSTSSTSTTSTTDAFIAQYRTVYDSFTTPPSESVAEAQNTMVSSLVSAGVWAKLDQLVILAQESNGDGEALKNWITPGTNDATLVNAPTFVSLEGFTSNGTTSYINTQFSLANDSTQYTRNSASFFAYLRTDIAQNGYSGLNSTCDIYFRPRSESDSTVLSINANDIMVGAGITDAKGFWLLNRTASNDMKGYRNNVQVATETKVSTALVNETPFIMALNTGGTPSAFMTNQFSVFGFGASLDATERGNLQNAIEAYMDSNSKGIIT